MISLEYCQRYSSYTTPTFARYRGIFAHRSLCDCGGGLGKLGDAKVGQARFIARAPRDTAVTSPRY